MPFTDRGPANQHGWTGWCSHPWMGCTQSEIHVPEEASWVSPQTHRCCHPGTRGIYPLLSVFLQTGSFGVQILWGRLCYDFLFSGTGMHFKCKIIIFFHNFELSTHGIKFSVVCAPNLVRIVIKCRRTRDLYGLVDNLIDSLDFYFKSPAYNKNFKYSIIMTNSVYDDAWT